MIRQQIREPRCDIEAQIAALCDAAHPKDAVFIGIGTPEPYVDVPGVLKIARNEGTLFTTSQAKAARFSKGGISEDDMAEILGYPEPKSSVFASDGCVTIQAMDENGNVVTEAVASIRNMHRTIAALSTHVPDGGALRAVHVMYALFRRNYLTKEEK